MVLPFAHRMFSGLRNERSSVPSAAKFVTTSRVGGFRDIINHDDLISDVPGETAHRPDGQPDLTRRVTREDQNGNKRCLALSFGPIHYLAEAASFFGKDSHKIPGCRTRADPGGNR